MRHRILAFTVVVFFAVAHAFAQAPTLKVRNAMDDYNRASNDEDRMEAAVQLIQALVETTMEGKASPTIPAIIQSIDLKEGRRLALELLGNRQEGAPAGVGSGSALVGLKSISDLISGAMDSGAFTKNTQGTVSSFRANLEGTYRLISGECPADAVQVYPMCITESKGPAKGLSVSLSFDTSRASQVTPGNPTNPGASAQALLLRARNGIAAFSARYDFYRPWDQKAAGFEQNWKASVDDLRKKSGAYAEALGEGPSALVAEAIKEGKPAQLHALLAPLQPDARLAAATEFVNAFLAAPGHQVAAEARVAFAAANKAFLKNEVEFFRDTLDRKLFTLETTYIRPKDEPEYGNVRLISSFTAGSHMDDKSGALVPNWEITLNAAADLFFDRKDVQGGRRFRDFQLGVQADHKMWRWRALRTPTLSVAAYYQRITDDLVIQFNSDALAPGTNIPLPKPANVILEGTKGDIGIIQTKLTIPLGGGVSFPLAVSWSNRTELLKFKGNNVRGNFGLQFDLDKLVSSFR